ncbi:hypothetical protein Tco_1539423 [Tanacetum coccineum]
MPKSLLRPNTSEKSDKSVLVVVRNAQPVAKRDKARRGWKGERENSEEHRGQVLLIILNYQRKKSRSRKIHISEMFYRSILKFSLGREDSIFLYCELDYMAVYGRLMTSWTSNPDDVAKLPIPLPTPQGLTSSRGCRGFDVDKDQEDLRRKPHDSAHDPPQITLPSSSDHQRSSVNKLPDSDPKVLKSQRCSCITPLGLRRYQIKPSITSILMFFIWLAGSGLVTSQKDFRLHIILMSGLELIGADLVHGLYGVHVLVFATMYGLSQLVRYIRHKQMLRTLTNSYPERGPSDSKDLYAYLKCRPNRSLFNVWVTTSMMKLVIRRADLKE